MMNRTQQYIESHSMIDYGLFIINQIAVQNKATPSKSIIEMMIDKATGYSDSKNLEIADTLAAALRLIVKHKTIMEYDCDSEKESLKKVNRIRKELRAKLPVVISLPKAKTIKRKPSKQPTLF